MAVSLGSAVLTIGGDASGLNQVLRRAEGMTSQAMQRVGQASRALGYTMTAIGTGITTSLGYAANAAISFESAFAGVRKTMDASEEEFAAMNRELRAMAMVIPVSANELARIAELGAQLGVPKEAIIEFTRTVADLSVATDLTAESAATMMAQFMNILQLPWSQFDNIGAAIVDLGNNGASTEAQISEFALRLAGAGKVAGLSAQDILGFGSALASLGINAEAGGTAFSKVFIMLRSAVDMGGESLEDFAKIAGMTSEKFVAAYKDDPATAIIAFVEGLGKIEKAGGSLFQTLAALDIKEIRLRDSLLRTSGAGQLVAQHIKLANEAFRENSALTDEATKRYATTASQIQILKNTFNELAMQLGEVLLPYVRQFAEWSRAIVTQLIGWVQANPQLVAELMKFAVIVGLVATAIGPVLIALPGLAIGFSAIGSVLAALATPIGIVVALIVGGLVVAFMYLREHMEQAKLWIASNWERITAAFNTARQIITTTMAIIGQALRVAWLVISAVFAGVVTGISNDLQRLGDKTGQYTNDWLGTLQMVLDWVMTWLPVIEGWVRWLADQLELHWGDMVAGVTRFYNGIVQPMVLVGKLFYEVATIVVREATRMLVVVQQLARLFGFLGGGDAGAGPAIPPAPGAPKQYARGGVTRRPGLAYVHRDELMHLPGGTRIYNKRDTQEMLGGGGGVQMGGVTINVSGVNDPKAIARVVAVELERELQNTLAKRGRRLPRG